jgi:hypothetical protein
MRATRRGWRFRFCVAAAAAASLVVMSGAAASLDGITPPTAILSGTPGNSGWWRSDVTVQWNVDLGNGFVSSEGCGPAVVPAETPGTTLECSATYEDLDGGTTTVTRTTPPIRIDTTAPSVDGARPKRPPDRYGWYSHDIRINFHGSDALSGLQVCTNRVYRGPTSARASVTGRCKDLAGNTAEGTFTFKYAEPFLTPKSGTRVSGPPEPDWPRVARAKYYNFQLWHNGKVLSRWPQKSRVELRRHWHFAGRRHSLEPGRYDWYVWPHYNGRYHARLGHGVFYVRAN